jgi:hypothetical protein
MSSCKKDLHQVTGVIIPPALPVNNGSVHFWTGDMWFVFDPLLYVKINNETQILEDSRSGLGAPSECCHYCGTIDFDMLPGTYEWKTWRAGRDTVKGTVTVIANRCIMEQVNY